MRHHIVSVSIWRGEPYDRIELRAEDGSAGIGEGRWGEELLRARPEAVVGRSPFEAEAIYEELPEAGGLDMALWDLMGRMLERPARELLGKVYRTAIPCCASVDQPGEAPGFEMIRLRRDWPDRGGLPEAVRLGVRCTAPALDAALVQAARLENALLEFWEAPLAPEDLDGYRRLKEKVLIPIAAGPEVAPDRLITDFIQRQLADVVIADVSRHGLTGLRRLAYYCWLFRVRLVPYFAASGAAFRAATQAAACIPPASNALNPPPVFVLCAGVPEGGGRLELAGEPGLGGGIAAPGGPPDLVLGAGS